MKALYFLISLITMILAHKTSYKGIIKAKTFVQIKKNATWEPYPIHENPFLNYTHKDLNTLLGANLKWTHENIWSLIDDDDHSQSENIPNAFDSRVQWSDCITPIRNQEHCGSCWAFSSATVLSDRFCIASKGKINVVLSPQYLVSCDKNESGCEGGFLEDTWAFLEKEGIVTDKCFSYKSGDGKLIPSCSSVCENSSEKFFTYKAITGSSKQFTCSLQMQKEILTNGPVQTGFIVYEDFMHYKSGIYQYTGGRKLGGHAVRVIGWGLESGVKYWIVANSWGSLWGENGFFRIAFGECLFEANAYAGLPDVSTSQKLFLK